MTCLVNLAIKDHDVEFISLKMPQDDEESKDSLGISETGLVKTKTSDEVLKALENKQRLAEIGQNELIEGVETRA